VSRLRLFRCPRPLARTAVERWHYSGTLPAAGLDCYGVREAGRFVGVVVFGMGANYRLAASFALGHHEMRELARVALCAGRSIPTSRVVAAALRRLHRERPGVRLVVSYADTAHGHIGTLYQAGNWHYLGVATRGRTLHLLGRSLHNRSVWQRWGTSRLDWLRRHVDAGAFATADRPKHKYAWAYDRQMRRRLRRLARPYPRAVEESQATRPVPDRERHVRSMPTAPNGRQKNTDNSTTASRCPKRVFAG
jgi:hypothetical protein